MNNRFIWTCFFFCIFVINAEAQDTTLTKLKRANLSEMHYENGVSHFNRSAYHSAIDEFERSVNLNAFNYLAYYFMALSFERLNKLPEALTNYTLSYTVKADFTEALFNRGIIYYKLNRFEEAIQDFEKLLSMPPGETQAIYFKGINYGVGDADATFGEVISMYEKEADIFNYLGLCHYQSGNLNQARSDFQKALERNPKDDNIYVNAGLTYLESGNLDSARFYFQNALSINPYNSIAKFNMALCNPDSASIQMRQLDRLIGEHSEFPMAYAQRAYQNYLTGNLEAAIADYDTALSLDPHNSEYLMERGIMYEKIHALDRAYRDFNTVIDLDGNNYQAWYNLANICFKKNDFSESVEYYTQALSLNPHKPEIYHNRALAYYYLKEPDKACQDMEKAASLGSRQADKFILRNCQ